MADKKKRRPYTVIIKLDEIQRAKDNIVQLFVDQCRNGAQSKILPDGLIACGQFLGAGAESTSQHGLHGTAAALRVLASSTRDDALKLVDGLVAYLEVCFGCRPAPVGVGDLCKDPDIHNVVKIGEILHALSFVKIAEARTERLKLHLVNRLRESIKDGQEKGWGYWVCNPEDKVEIIPTAYAIRGLVVHGFRDEALGPSEYLMKQVRAPVVVHGSEESDPIVRTLSLFVLSETERFTRKQEVNLSSDFQMLWRKLGALMSVSIEQNIEYRGLDRNEYIRLPWQLYLIALAAQYKSAIFASAALQRRLSGIINAVNAYSGGFRYPFSGDLISSRTNAILYDVLTILEPKLQNSGRYRFLYALDRLWTAASRVLNSRWLRGALAIAAIAFGCWSMVTWWRDDQSTVADVAPEFLGSLALLLMTGRKTQ